MLPFELTKDTPYLALSGELWSVFCEYFNRNWPCYKGFLLYIYSAAGWFRKNFQGAVSIRKTVLPGMAIPMLKIRRPNGRLIFNMEITIRR